MFIKTREVKVLHLHLKQMISLMQTLVSIFISLMAMKEFIFLVNLLALQIYFQNMVMAG